ncbi:MAG: GspH/FimT family pseudopilin [Nitrospira sp.]|nr:GspH/FimT family pseudopilin [Nitrospira sp.]MCB9711759.1 GspH/FimT family pseudopilin [Nitrospiraceae bacterium]MDR4488655.1 GspH/FimT family pseudopilin [Nitrospirales bacterium]MCA9467235.1 GspH/FimT family pseudopilin [Nitrospira sp.]MCA9474262.1 GspH/FimT family pseudopilin [Nitrospira sp.]
MSERNLGMAEHPIRRTQPGFTIVELMIVLAIGTIGIMLTQTWLTTQLPKWRLNGAVRQLVSDLQAAKMKAVVERNRQRIIFLDTHRYMVVDDDNNNGMLDPGEKVEDRDIQRDYRDVTLAATNNPSFLPRGTASNLASISVTNTWGTRIITVSITGRVKVKV